MSRFFTAVFPVYIALFVITGCDTHPKPSAEAVELQQTKASLNEVSQALSEAKATIASLENELAKTSTEAKQAADQLAEVKQQLQAVEKARIAIPDLFRTQAQVVLQHGTKLQAMTKQGSPYKEFADQLADTQGALDLALSVWPSVVEESIKQRFQRALSAWSLAASMWYGKLRDYDPPTEPDINGFADANNFISDGLRVEIHGPEFIVERYRGKKFIPYEPNISILLAIGSERFEEAKTALLQQLSK